MNSFLRTILVKFNKLGYESSKSSSDFKSEVAPLHDDSPVTGSIITFLSFMLCSVIPLLSYLVNLFPGINMSRHTTLYLSCFLTVITLFLLGAVKGILVGQKMWIAGGSMAINGTIVAACGWVIGYLLQLTSVQNIW